MKIEYINLIRDCSDEIVGILDHVLNHVSDKNNIYIQRYIVLKCSGTIEYIFKHMIADKLSQGAVLSAQTYFDKVISQSSLNPGYDNICSLFKKAGNTWLYKFKDKFPKSDIHSINLDCLIDTRNKIAHGIAITTPSVQITRQQFILSCRILSWIYNELS